LALAMLLPFFVPTVVVWNSNSQEEYNLGWYRSSPIPTGYVQQSW
jgi:hypothetical protein